MYYNINVKKLNRLIIIFIFAILISCSSDGDKKSSDEGKSPSKDQNTQEQTKDSSDSQNPSITGGSKTNKDFKELVDKKGQTESDKERMIEKGIIKTAVIAKRIDNNTEVKEVVVQINQIDNSAFPVIKCFVSVTDLQGNPLNVDPNLFFVEENGFGIPKNSIKGVTRSTTVENDPKGNFMPINAILAIDKSGTMAAHGEGDTESKMYHAKNAALDFIKQVRTEKGDIVKVMAFDGDVHYLGLNESSIEGINNLIAKGDTALYGVLLSSVRELEQGTGVKAVILMTDGMNDTRGSVNPTMKKITLGEGLALAEKLSIPVFSIAFGKDADEETMKKIATSTHALYFKATQNEELKNLYNLIRNIINNQYIISYESNSQQIVTDVEISLGGQYKDRRIFTTPDEVVEREKNLRTQLRIVKKRDEELKSLEDELFKKEQELTSAREKVNTMKAEAIDKEMKSKEEMNQALKKEEETKKRNEELTAFDAKIKKLQEDLNLKDKELTDLRNQLDAKQKALEQKEAQQNDWQKKLEEEDKRIAAEKERLKNLKENLTTIVNTIKNNYKSIDDNVNQTLKQMDTVKP